MKRSDTMTIYTRTPLGVLRAAEISMIPVADSNDTFMQGYRMAYIAFLRLKEHDPKSQAVLDDGMHVVTVADPQGEGHLVSIVARIKANDEQVVIPARLEWHEDRCVLVPDSRPAIPWKLTGDGAPSIDWSEIQSLIAVDDRHHGVADAITIAEGSPPCDPPDPPPIDYEALLLELGTQEERVKLPVKSFDIGALEKEAPRLESVPDPEMPPEAEPEAMHPLEPATANPKPATIRRPLPWTVPTMRVMEHVPLTPLENLEWSSAAQIHHQYKMLSDPLPLLGGMAMEMSDGVPRIAASMLELFPWMEDVIEQVINGCHLQVAAGRPWFHMPPTLLVGPPGSGKSHFARTLARVAGVAHTSLDCAATHDAVTIAGTPRGFSTATPCLAAVIMERSRSANPILQLDEIEKSSRSSHGYVPDAVLGMTEPSTNSSYYDQCLLRALDLTACTWIATANDAGLLSGPLKSRFDVITVPAARGEHLEAVIRSLSDEVAAEWNMQAAQLADIPSEAMKLLRERLEAGSLRSVASLLRRLWSRDIVENGRPDIN